MNIDDYILNIGRLSSQKLRELLFSNLDAKLAEDLIAKNKDWFYGMENNSDFIREECHKTAAWLRMQRKYANTI